MARMRDAKKRLMELLESPAWQESLPAIASGGFANIGALKSFLTREPELMHRAALAIGLAVEDVEREDPEAAKDVIRRFMWSMNEESGNIGWGVPDAFAECLAASQSLAETYYRILVSYIIDLGHDDNYCDNDQLRRSCYWGVGRLAETRPRLAGYARPWLLKGLADRDAVCRGLAAWALGKLRPTLMDAPGLRRLADSGDDTLCEVFEERKMRSATVSGLAAEALAKTEK